MTGASANDYRYKVIYPGVCPLGTGKPIGFNDLNEIIMYKTGSRLHPGKYFLFYSTFEPRKNTSSLVRAFYELNQEADFKHYKLVLVGGEGWGNIKKGLSAFVDEHYPIKAKSPILILDYLSDTYLEGLIKQSTAVVYPSLYEGFGLPVLEALQYGASVITSNNSSLPEVGGDLVRYIDPHNYLEIKQAMMELAVNKKAMNKKKLTAQVHQFTWQKNAEETYRFYRQLLKTA